MTKADLPFELWRTIFQDVYATKTQISYPPSDFVISKLQSRLNIYRCLASVSKSWRINARDIFFEDLQVHTIEALQGLVKLFGDSDGRRLALAVSRLDFSFPEFRCSASIPRRPRPLVPEPAPIEITSAPARRRRRRRDRLVAASASASASSSSSSSSTHPSDWRTIYRRNAQKYRPSLTDQGYHWLRWQEGLAKLLTVCSSASHVSINFTSSRVLKLSLPYAVDHSFPPPDLSNSLIAEKLLKSTNLKSLTLVDPAPLKVFGSAFGEWKRLKSLDITLTFDFREFPHTAFIPPRSLHVLRFYDLSFFGNFSWPLSSDMDKCTNIQVLDLGVSHNNAATMKAIAFLCSACQHTLQTLILRAFRGTIGITEFHTGGNGNRVVFDYDIFHESQPFHFENLERLHLPNSICDISLFGSFKADKLKIIEVGGLTLGPDTEMTEENWSHVLSHSILQALSHLIINSKDPDSVLSSVCEKLGVKLRTGCSMVGDTKDIYDMFGTDF